MTAAPSIKHQTVVVNLTVALGSFVQRHDRGLLFVAPCDVVLSAHDVVEPDLFFLAKERLGLLTEKHLGGAPDLVIEVLSPSTQRIDEGIKHRLYERMGVPEYWLVDPALGTVEVHRRSGAGFGRVAELSAAASDVLTTPLLPGLEISLAAVFA